MDNLQKALILMEALLNDPDFKEYCRVNGKPVSANVTEILAVEVKTAVGQPPFRKKLVIIDV